jgi:hypothetical protein
MGVSLALVPVTTAVGRVSDRNHEEPTAESALRDFRSLRVPAQGLGFGDVVLVFVVNHKKLG